MIIILGMAGAGKSTQCKMLEEAGGFQWFSVGQLLRNIETGVERAEMAQGKVLDDSIVTPIVLAELNRLTDSPEILLDGCPRTVGQAKWLAAAENTPTVRIVLHMVIADDIASERLLKRKREDDTLEAMKKRFAGYHRDIGLVLDEFRAKGVKVVDVDADLAVDEVFVQIQEAVKR